MQGMLAPLFRVAGGLSQGGRLSHSPRRAPAPRGEHATGRRTTASHRLASFQCELAAFYRSPVRGNERSRGEPGLGHSEPRYTSATLRPLSALSSGGPNRALSVAGPGCSCSHHPPGAPRRLCPSPLRISIHICSPGSGSLLLIPGTGSKLQLRISNPPQPNMERDSHHSHV
ncbi:unnamed protein product [Pleuronectes platessa]|uniref:Uncharacterized protein n=1 Tax=Pleuronectes platessa TaxID=8262 RepID=A0A9N7YB70_PLEPL|nr:unnamed protein product [Pleuronectes platessa]